MFMKCSCQFIFCTIVRSQQASVFILPPGGRFVLLGKTSDWSKANSSGEFQERVEGGVKRRGLKKRPLIIELRERGGGEAASQAGA